MASETSYSFIKPKCPIYKVDYVEVRQDYSDANGGGDIFMKHKQIIGLFNLLPENVQKRKLTGKHKEIEISLWNCPIAQENLDRCGSVFKYDNNNTEPVEWKARKEIEEPIIEEYNKYLPFITKKTIDDFEKNRYVNEQEGVIHIFKSIERVA